MSKDIDRYAERMDIRKFGQIMPRRMGHIMPAPETVPKLDYAANLTAWALHPECQYLKVNEIIEREAGAKTYVLGPDNEKGTEKLAYFRPGQFLSFYLEIGHSILTRPYSLCSSPLESTKGRYEITIKPSYDGFAGNWICRNWSVGTSVKASCPMGEFFYEELRDAGNVVAVAGGSGITPFISMARAIADGDEQFNLTILYGNKDKDSILFKAELDELCSLCSRVKVVYVLSDQSEDGFESGFITEKLIRKYAPENDEYSLFICGNAAMNKFLCKEVPKLGIPRKYIRKESYGATSPAFEEDWSWELADKTFKLTVLTKDTESTIPCSSMETILVAMERAGIVAPSRCRSGECGMCRSHMVSGSIYVPGRLEHRKKGDIEYGYIHPCCSFPISDVCIELECERGIKSDINK